MLIQIGQAVPLIGRALQGVASVWDHVISWFSKEQSCMALSTVEAEYVTSCLDSCEAVWLRKLLSDLFDLQLDATCIYCDNYSCVKLLENLVFHDSQSISRSSITISGIWCRKEQ